MADTPGEQAQRLAKDGGNAHWGQCDPAQKCERLRQKLHQQANRIEALEAMVAEVMQHKHLQTTGEIVVPSSPALAISRRVMRTRIMPTGNPDQAWI